MWYLKLCCFITILGTEEKEDFALFTLKWWENEGIKKPKEMEVIYTWKTEPLMLFGLFPGRKI